MTFVVSNSTKQLNSTSVQLHSDSSATFTYAFPAMGSYTVNASYSGDASFGASPPSQITQAVLNTSTIGVSSSASSNSYGLPVTFTATVAGVPSGNPTGTVDFFDNFGGVNSSLGTGTITNGVAVYTTSSPLAIGKHLITATYSGDTNFGGCTTGYSITYKVNAASTSTALTSSLTSPATSVYGQSVTITATVSSSSGIPTGSIAFMDGSSAGHCRAQRRGCHLHLLHLHRRVALPNRRLYQRHRQLQHQHLAQVGPDCE